MAGSWLIASVLSDLTTAMSSATVATFGSSSLTQRPHLPCCANLNIGATQGNDFCPAVMPVTRCPMRTDAGGGAAEELAAGEEQLVFAVGGHLATSSGNPCRPGFHSSQFSTRKLGTRRKSRRFADNTIESRTRAVEAILRSRAPMRMRA